MGISKQRFTSCVPSASLVDESSRIKICYNLDDLIPVCDPLNIPIVVCPKIHRSS